MIPVAEASAPGDFNKRVRQKGLDAIAELVGEKPSQSRPGRKRNKVAETRDAIPADAFPPYWRDVLPDMLESYRRICAYLALYIEHATGSPSVDHVVPKSRAWDQVYEWSNYRLAAALINSKKNDVSLTLDPFTISDGWFALEFVEFQVKAGASAVGSLRTQVDDTESYEAGPGKGGIDLPYLVRRAPFIAQELRRQGRLLRGDV